MRVVGAAQPLKYKPNLAWMLGAGCDYKWIGAELTFKLPLFGYDLARKGQNQTSLAPPSTSIATSSCFPRSTSRTGVFICTIRNSCNPTGWTETRFIRTGTTCAARRLKPCAVPVQSAPAFRAGHPAAAGRTTEERAIPGCWVLFLRTRIFGAIPPWYPRPYRPIFGPEVPA